MNSKRPVPCLRFRRKRLWLRKTRGWIRRSPKRLEPQSRRSAIRAFPAQAALCPLRDANNEQPADPPSKMSATLLGKRVASRDGAAAQALREPMHSLLRTPMRKRFGLHLAAHHLLDVIVAHRGSCSQRGFHVGTFEQAALLSGMRPNSCQAVGLQFHHHRESIARLGAALLQLPDLALNPGYFLDVMPHLVREHISLRELSGRAKALLQLIVKTQIDIDLLVGRAIKRACCRLCSAAPRCSGIAKEHELRVAIRHSCLLRQKLLPRLLGVVEHERNKLHQRLLCFVSRRVRRPTDRRAGRGPSASAQQRKEDQQPAQAKPHTAETEAASAAGLIAAILYVITGSAGCPTHGRSPCREIR